MWLLLAGIYTSMDYNNYALYNRGFPFPLINSPPHLQHRVPLYCLMHVTPCTWTPPLGVLANGLGMPANWEVHAPGGHSLRRVGSPWLTPPLPRPITPEGGGWNKWYKKKKIAAVLPMLACNVAATGWAVVILVRCSPLCIHTMATWRRSGAPPLRPAGIPGPAR